MACFRPSSWLHSLLPGAAFFLAAGGRMLAGDVTWPLGGEFAPERYAEVAGRLETGLNEADPLGVAPGIGLPDYDSDGVADESDAFPADPAETLDTDGDGTGNNADTDDDNDGVPDAYETANGLNPLANDAAGDVDGDGIPNGAEYIAGSNPRSSSSRFSVQAVSFPGPTTVRLTWHAIPGRFYAVQRTSLTHVPAETLERNISVSTAGAVFRDYPRTSSSGFYILKASLAPIP